MRTGFLDRLGARLCETNLFALFLGLVTRNGAVGVVGVCDYEKGGFALLGCLITQNEAVCFVSGLGETKQACGHHVGVLFMELHEI